MPAAVIGPTLVPALAVPTEPVQPSLPVPPLAVQEVALAEAQDSCVEPPTCREAGVATRFVTLAAGGEVAVTLTLTD